LLVAVASPSRFPRFAAKKNFLLEAFAQIEPETEAEASEGVNLKLEAECELAN